MEAAIQGCGGVASGGRYGCPLEAALDVVGGRWKGILLYELIGGPKRFGELRRSAGATQRMVTLQLREMEADGLVHRRVYAEAPPRVEYSLTEFGASLAPILLALSEWGSEHLGRIKAAKAAAESRRAQAA